ncbi:MAG: hypothetical protein ABI480_13570, partial [Chitinophagaceae bacterium]
GDGVFPPSQVEVWGGNNKNKLQLLVRIIPEQPTSKTKPYTKALAASFRRQSLKFIKIMARPVQKMPQWHEKKGKNAIMMADEVFIN